MKTAVDTNIFSRLWAGGPDAAVLSEVLQQCMAEGVVIVSPIVYAEILAGTVVKRQEGGAFLEATGIAVDFVLEPQVWRMAGVRYGEYAERKQRSGGGETRRLVADFVVGAHALLQADRLLTLDVRFKSDFPELALVRTHMS